LQKLAEPLVDTPVAVIERLLSGHEARTEQDEAASRQPGRHFVGKSRRPHSNRFSLQSTEYPRQLT
jgi:hypothetical protein